jgi:hypothetical protein
MKIKLLSVGTPTANGNIYPREVLEAAIKGKDKMIAVFGQDMPTADINLVNAAGLVSDFEFTDDSLYANVKLMSTPAAGLLAQQLGDSYECRPFGIGRLNENKEVYEYELRGFSIVPPES